MRGKVKLTFLKGIFLVFVQSVSKHHKPPGPHTAQRKSDVDDVTGKAPSALPDKKKIKKKKRKYRRREPGKDTMEWNGME